MLNPWPGLFLEMRSGLVFRLALGACCVVGSGVLSAADGGPLLWDEAQRSFLQDGPGWLLSEADRDSLLESDEVERQRQIDEFLSRDPIPATEENELITGIQRRRQLVTRELLSYLDDRSRLLFLHGEPLRRDLISCDVTLVPLEVWWFGDPKVEPGFVLYEPLPGEPYRLWLPVDSKRVLYGEEMENWLDQVAEVLGQGRGPRFDRQLCKQTKLLDDVTGIDGLFGFRKNRPTNKGVLQILEPPRDLAAWAEAASLTPLEEIASLQVSQPEVLFPSMNGQRMLVRFLLRVPQEAGLQVFEENGKSEVRVKIEGVIEREGVSFEDFHMRFQVPVKGETGEVALVVDRLLRPGDTFLVRMRIRDEIGKSTTTKTVAFRVPNEPVPGDEVPNDLLVTVGSDARPQAASKEDALFLIPPETDVVLGLWRAATLISGDGIVKVVFFVDDKPMFTRIRPPFNAELRLTKYPTEQVIRIEGYDENGELLAFDEVVLNQQRGRLEIRVSEPRKGARPSGTILAKAYVVVPEEKRVEAVEFSINDEILVTLIKPPWEAPIEIPDSTGRGALDYLTMTVTLADGTRAEDVRFLTQPEYLEEVDVDFVELYTSVDGDPTRRLQETDFSIFEDKRPQEIRKFELVENLPITIGITLDTSGSMIETLGEAKRSAAGFLDNIITPRDQSFAVSFSNRPSLIMPRTSDVGAVATALENMHAVGNTALYDAVITSLYYFRGVRGRRALVLLSDGEDTASTISFKDSLEYARRSGVVIYSIGLAIPRTSMGVRAKLLDYSKETGGRAFFISRAEELRNVYASIEHELRSQYLLAYLSDAPQESEHFRTVVVKVKGRLKARTISGYYP